MEPHDPRTFSTLACPACEGITFSAVVHLRHKPGGGLVPDQTGFACLRCQTVVDIASALRSYTLKQKREELRSLEEELGISSAVQQQSQLVPGDENA